jgi:hypothetical protein
MEKKTTAVKPMTEAKPAVKSSTTKTKPWAARHRVIIQSK